MTKKRKTDRTMPRTLMRARKAVGAIQPVEFIYALPRAQGIAVLHKLEIAHRAIAAVCEAVKAPREA